MNDDTVACCGLFCESCGVYIATANNDVVELTRMALMMKVDPKEMPCAGCRSDTLSPHCRECEFRECAAAKKIGNCEDCDGFPCEKLRAFKLKMPHRAELFESAGFRKERGVDEWRKKMAEDYSCGRCGTLNSPYYAACKACGNEPANPFAARNRALFGK